LEGLLGPAEHEKRFDWARGDRGTRAKGAQLPFDAVWEAHRLIVEGDERQHSKAVPFFDKRWRRTVSGVHRGEQRRLYDERKVAAARARGYRVVRIPYSDLTHDEASDLAYLRARLRSEGINS
jgi:very-short-patch-repair endonuclease